MAKKKPVTMVKPDPLKCREARRKSVLSQQEVGDKMQEMGFDFGRRYVVKLENGQFPVLELAIVRGLAQLYDLHPAYLLALTREDVKLNEVQELFYEEMVESIENLFVRMEVEEDGKKVEKFVPWQEVYDMLVEKHLAPKNPPAQ